MEQTNKLPHRVFLNYRKCRIGSASKKILKTTELEKYFNIFFQLLN